MPDINNKETHELELLEKRVKDAKDRATIRANGGVNDNLNNTPRALRNATSLVAEFVGTVGIFTACGFYLDKHFNFFPLWTLLLFLLGLVIGGLNGWRLVKGFGYAAGYKR